MNKFPAIAVCLAAYNGSKYIEAQIISILSQLKSSDVLYIADDCSTDNTLEVIESIKDRRINLIKNIANVGYIDNFNKLATKVDADYIFFSDQDDIWAPGRVDLMIDAADKYEKNIVFGCFSLLDSTVLVRNDRAAINNSSLGILNITKIMLGWNVFPYFGSTMMITRKAKKYLFPLASNHVSHDIWIALIGNWKKDIFHLPNIVTLRRIHLNNLTNPSRSVFLKLMTRWIWIKCLFGYAFKNSTV